jgi:hypothetical protein
MTQQALAKIIQKHIPAVVFRCTKGPNISYDSAQRGVDRYVGYRALWMKVIIRAAFDWVSYRDAMKLESRKEAEKAYKWLFQPSQLFNSFENVCHLVDLPPDKIRHWVQTLTKEHVAKIEHLEREGGGVPILEAERRLIENMDEDEDA